MKTADLIEGHVYEIEYASYGMYTGKVEKVKQHGWGGTRYVRHPVFSGICEKDADVEDHEWIIEEGGTPWKRGDLREPRPVLPAQVTRHFADSVEHTLVIWDERARQQRENATLVQAVLDQLKQATGREWYQSGSTFRCAVHITDMDDFIAGLKEIHGATVDR